MDDPGKNEWDGKFSLEFNVTLWYLSSHPKKIEVVEHKIPVSGTIGVNRSCYKEHLNNGPFLVETSSFPLLSYSQVLTEKMEAGLGFEPRYLAYETSELPVLYPATIVVALVGLEPTWYISIEGF